MTNNPTKIVMLRRLTAFCNYHYHRFCFRYFFKRCYKDSGRIINVFTAPKLSLLSTTITDYRIKTDVLIKVEMFHCVY